MSHSKNMQDDQDPDYATPGPSNDAHQKQYEETARANLARRITAIVEKEFSKEIDTKEKEILQIEGRIHKALKTLHFLRYVIITDFYNRKQCQVVQATGESKQTRIHPAIKRIIGKSPKTTETLFEDQGLPSTDTWPLTSMKIETASPDETTNNEIDKRLGNCVDVINNDSTTLTRASNGKRCQEDSKDETTDDGPPKKIPRYVPPKSGIPEPQVPSRGARHKIRKRIIVGNISKWISPDWREDAASHKWTMYVRGTKENPEISDFVGKIRFFLHPSYRPNDVVEITSPPFHLSRRGWGEFPVRVQLHFKNPLNKPMDIIHYLKLDRTYTGLQTLGSETVVDVWIKSTTEVSAPEGERTENSKSNQFFDDVGETIKQEPPDTEKSSSNENIPYEVTDWSERIKAETKIKEEVSSHVYLEHDYVNFPDYDTVELWEKENNVTISHSPPRNATRDQHSSFHLPAINGNSGSQHSCPAKSTLKTAAQGIVEICEADGSQTGAVQTPRIVNGNCTNMLDFMTITDNGEPVITIEACKPSSQSTNASNIQTGRDVQTMASNLEYSSSKLQPLRIAIPAAFEALRRSVKMPSNQKKQILVMRDNKLITVNATSPIKNQGSQIGIDASTIVSTSVPVSKLPKSNVQRASVSLLKKSNVGNSKATIFTLNSKNSLLLDSTNHIPALKVVETTTPNARRLYLVEKKMPHRTTVSILSKTKSKLKESTAGENSLDSCKLVTKPKITLGKDRIGTTSKKNHYQEILRSIDDVQITDVSALVRFIIRRLPLVTERATDPEYKNLHPYAVASEKEFLDSSVAKQRALEWYRAKHVKSFLKKKSITEEQQWTVKEIMIWSRLHGHTPIRFFPNVAARNAGGKSADKNHPGDMPKTNSCTFTEPTGLLEILHSANETKGATGTKNTCDNDIEIIDVESITDSKSAEGEDACKKKMERRTIISLGIPEKIVALQSYVCDTTRQIGVKLEPEEIVPGVMHCAPARLMVRAVQCLLEDLLRSSLAKAWERSIDGGCPDAITLEDVRGAILNREEFDVFTNKGLGSHHCPDD